MARHAEAAPPAGRRAFIRLAGGGAVLALLPLSACSTDMPPSAVQAWQAVDPGLELRRWVLAHALLAPNPHNRQPWMADLRQPGQILLICDGERLLPETDPWGRQILIGCGAFIELAVMAAAERGHRLHVEPFPKGEPDAFTLPAGALVARLRLERDASLAYDPLFAQIRRRHSHKGWYDTSRRVAPAHWQALLATASGSGLQAGAVVEPGAMAALRRITREAFEAEMLTPRSYLESARLLRIGPEEVQQHRDGIALMDSQLRLMSALGLFNRVEPPQQDSSAMAQIRKRWAAHETASGYLWIASPDNSRLSQLLSGRAYVRAHLEACALGLAMHPLSQALQEFPEVRPHFEALRRQLGIVEGSASTVQMLARVGYGIEPATPSPRRDLADLLQV